MALKLWLSAGAFMTLTTHLVFLKIYTLYVTLYYSMRNDQQAIYMYMKKSMSKLVLMLSSQLFTALYLEIVDQLSFFKNNNVLVLYICVLLY
jgi:hypothetical protein